VGKVGHWLQRIRPALAGSLLMCLTSLFLSACIFTGDQSIEADPRDKRPQDVIDRIRAIDLQPRAPQNVNDGAVGSARPARPAVYLGDTTAPLSTVGRGDTAPSTGEGFDLNFENAPVTSVAKVILGDILGVGYAIDPRVQGTVSLASGRPVSKSDILFVLENALRMSNVALLRDRGGYRLVPASEAAGGGKLDDVATAEPGQGLSVVPLQYVSAQTMLKLLDGFGVKQNTTRADVARNMLLVQGSGADRRAAIETILSFDADWMRGQSVGIFPLHNSAPDATIAEIEKIMDAGDGGLGQNMVKFQSISRINAILVVSRKPEYLKTAGTWISRLDRSDTEGTSLKVYRLRYGNARPIALLLNDIIVGKTSGSIDSAASQIAPGTGVSSSTSGPLGALSALPPRSAATAAPGGMGGTGGTVSTSNMRGGATAGGGADAAATVAPAADVGGFSAGRGQANVQATIPNVRITADIANNSILVYANQDSHRIVEQTLRQIDRPQLQVGIEATIAEVTLNENVSYGVQFFLNSEDVKGRPDKGSVLNTVGGAVSGAVLGRALPGFNFLLGSETQPRLIIDALHGVTDVKVLSNPSLVVMDNQVATLQVGDQVPVSTGIATVLTANNTVVNTIDYRNTGIILRVLPRVSSNGNVVLDIEQEISNVASGSGTTSLTPTVSQRKVKSSISVATGQTVLLAGLISEREDRQRQGIPLLDQLPGGLGDAFSHQNKTRTRTELIIFIRPTVIRDGFDAHVLAEELRSKLNGRLVGVTSASPTRPPLGRQ
jgi:general secretion pathway protein D